MKKKAKSSSVYAFFHIHFIPIWSGFCSLEKSLIQFSSAFCNCFLGGGNSNILQIFTPKIGEDEPILTNMFQLG